MNKPIFHDGIIDFRDEPPKIKMGEDLKRLGFKLSKIYDYDTQLAKVNECPDVAQGGNRTVFSVWTKSILIPRGYANTMYWGERIMDLTARVSFDGCHWECRIEDPMHRTHIDLDEDQLKEAKSIEIFGTKGYPGMREFKEIRS